MNTPSTLRELAGEPPVLCLVCHEHPPVRGYDGCFACEAAHLRDNPAELAAFVPMDADDHEILALAGEQLRKRA